MSHHAADEKFMTREEKTNKNCMWEWEKYNCPGDAE